MDSAISSLSYDRSSGKLDLLLLSLLVVSEGTVTMTYHSQIRLQQLLTYPAESWYVAVQPYQCIYCYKLTDEANADCSIPREIFNVRLHYLLYDNSDDDDDIGIMYDDSDNDSDSNDGDDTTAF